MTDDRRQRGAPHPPISVICHLPSLRPLSSVLCPSSLPGFILGNQGLFSQNRRFQLADFAVDEAAVPEALPEMPAEAGGAVEEAELEEVADAEVGKRAEVGRKFVVLRLASILE